ncbi:hypothetical protein LINGRAHAP2_LOCUS11925 [Linum grandiflorum]
MAVNPQKDQPAPSTIPTFRQHDYDDSLDDDLAAAAAASPSFCLCFPAHCFTRRRTINAGPRAYFLQTDQDDYPEEHQEGRWYSGGKRWVVEKLKKAREISEVVAGPKWKNFIRRFSRSAVGSVNTNKKRTAKFQYDPQSYALNFDDGDATADDCAYPDFSARFAAQS